MNKIIVLSGGISPEREVSIVSANYVTEALQKSDYEVIKLDPKDFLGDKGLDYTGFIRKINEISPIIVFNALHGGAGEDGTMQKVLELFNINFTGSGSKAALLAMDKPISMLIAKGKNIPVANYKILYKHEGQEKILQKILKNISLPLVIKPASLGSSVGVSIVKEENELKEAVAQGFAEENKIVAQKYIPGKEITVGILEGKALPVLEVKPKSGWYNYKNKYDQGKTEYDYPAKISVDASQRVQEYAEKMYSELECQDYARVDFRFDGKDFYFLEVNILPGITDHSIFCLAAKAAGFPYDDLINKIVKLNVK